MFFFGLVIVLSLYTCGDDVDKTKPTIDVSFKQAFPQNCDTLYFGETFTLKMLLEDNVELGAYSIDIHNNFDHHAHSTDVSTCDMDSVKKAVNPYSLIQDYAIPSGLTEYTTAIQITVPDSNNAGSYQEGDYHFFVSLTDKEGWSTQKGLSVKIVRRK